MRRCLLVALLLVLALAAEAGACSCVARSPQERMATADVAFIGTVTAVRSEAAPEGGTPTFVRRVRVYTVAVDTVYKGEVGATAEVRGEDQQGGSFTSCGETFEVGDELGGHYTGSPDEWFVTSCNRASRDDLEAGATGFPEPSGDGRAVALLVGPFASSPFAVLDSRGQVIAYARGRTSFGDVAVSPCPGGRHVIEASSSGVQTRRLSDLRVTRRLSSRFAYAVSCVDATGRTAVAARDGRLVRLRGGRERKLFGRSELVAAGPRASVVADRAGRVLLVDSRSGRVRVLEQRADPRAVSVSPDGDRVALLTPGRLTTYAIGGRRLARVAASGAAIAWRGRRAVSVRRAGTAYVGGKAWSPRRAGLEGTAVVALPAPARVRDASRFNPGPPAAASGGSRPRARRAPAGEGAPAGGCPKA